MVKCPVCKSPLDVEEEELDEGDPLSCDECGASLEVTGVDPIEIEAADGDDEDEDDEDEDDEDFDDEDEDDEDFADDDEDLDDEDEEKEDDLY